MALAVAGDEGSIAAMMTLLMGLRASEIITRTPRDVDDEARLLWIDDSSTQDGKDWTPKTEKGRRTIEIPEPLRPYLAKLAEDRKGKARLFWIPDGEHWRDWPAEQVRRICKLAKVPVVSAQSMRGLHSTLAVEAGATGHLVASTLGHESFSTTKESYARSDAVGRAERKRAMDVIQGGLR
jgi:integrase